MLRRPCRQSGMSSVGGKCVCTASIDHLHQWRLHGFRWHRNLCSAPALLSRPRKLEIVSDNGSSNTPLFVSPPFWVKEPQVKHILDKPSARLTAVSSHALLNKAQDLLWTCPPSDFLYAFGPSICEKQVTGMSPGRLAFCEYTSSLSLL